MQNKVVWITGASSGIGKAILLELLESKARVIASSRNLDALESLQLQYQSHLDLIPVDVTNIESINACMQQIIDKYGRIDIAILNAGNCFYVDANNFKATDIQKNFAVNFFGLVNCIEASLPLLRKSANPQLVGMSSAVAYIALPRAEGYGAAKAATRYLLQALQSNLKPHAIKVSIICPGFVKTPLTDANDFPMPFLVSAEYAAKYIIKGIQQQKTEISFPWRLVWLFKFLACLPDKMRIAILAKIVKSK